MNFDESVVRYEEALLNGKLVCEHRHVPVRNFVGKKCQKLKLLKCFFHFLRHWEFLPSTEIKSGNRAKFRIKCHYVRLLDNFLASSQGLFYRWNYQQQLQFFPNPLLEIFDPRVQRRELLNIFLILNYRTYVTTFSHHLRIIDRTCSFSSNYVY